MLKWLVVLLLCSSTRAADVDALVAQLDDDDFDRREAATHQLGRFSAEWAEKLIRLACKEPNPEVASRLRIAAKEVYLNTTIVKLPEWRELHGCWPFSAESMNIFHVEHVGDGGDGSPNKRYITMGMGLMVLWSDEKTSPLKSHDVIVGVNSDSLYNTVPRADDLYTLNIRRYKDTDKVAKDIHYIDADNTDYVEMDVKVTGDWKDPRQINWADEERIIDTKWSDFLKRLDEAADQH